MYVVAFLKLKYMCVIREVGQIPELLWKRMSRREFFLSKKKLLFYPSKGASFGRQSKDTTTFIIYFGFQTIIAVHFCCGF